VPGKLQRLRLASWQTLDGRQQHVSSFLAGAQTPDKPAQLDEFLICEFE